MANKVPTPRSEQDLTPACSSPPLLRAFFLPHKLWGTSAAAQCWWVPMSHPWVPARGHPPHSPQGFCAGSNRAGRAIVGGGFGRENPISWSQLSSGKGW